MRYGFYRPTRGRTATPEALEALGFHSVMIADHIGRSESLSESQDRMERCAAEIMARSSAAQ